MSCAGRLLLGCSLRGREPLDILWWAAMAQETRFSTQPLARGTQQRASPSLPLCPQGATEHASCFALLLGQALPRKAPCLYWYQQLILCYFQQWSVLIIHEQIHCMPDAWANFFTWATFNSSPVRQPGKHLHRRHYECYKRDPNYFWSLIWMILSGSVSSLSNLWHSKFPHSILK